MVNRPFYSPLLKLEVRLSEYQWVQERKQNFYLLIVILLRA